ncbi:uncharacterized protein LOC134534748 isoform X1 [Bacillus rossius redtenbacheri]|uniref:uncharacterized protein LOC134534748 isoform X1 n=1 Tax=Bacillus rossius redtenbacheri TaxID=93214 RepID=UPI002FDC84EF
MRGSRAAVLAAVVTALIAQGGGLRMGRLRVPQYRLRGESALLACDYDLGDDAVYSVKWYKDDEEFYRYVPRSTPPKSSYPVPGVRVDHVLSDDKTVALRSVNLQSSGLYRCEVSAEAPSFASAQKEARMEVVYLPKEGPHISGDQEYQPGDEVSLNCTSGRSHPASVLHWWSGRTGWCRCPRRRTRTDWSPRRWGCASGRPPPGAPPSRCGRAAWPACSRGLAPFRAPARCATTRGRSCCWRERPGAAAATLAARALCWPRRSWRWAPRDSLRASPRRPAVFRSAPRDHRRHARD